jgi:hypothetical protein
VKNVQTVVLILPPLTSMTGGRNRLVKFQVEKKAPKGLAVTEICNCPACAANNAALAVLQCGHFFAWP